MAIVQIHIEKTGGVTLQKLYAKKYGAKNIALYNIRDDRFAPYSIKTANYSSNIGLQFYRLIAKYAPSFRLYLVSKRTKKRQVQSIKSEDLPGMAVVIGHFDINRVTNILNPDTNEYRSVVREPLERTWSHYKYWKDHKGDLGQRYVPTFSKDLSFEEFAVLPGMINYQVNALGKDLTMYKILGVTENLTKFARETKLIHEADTAPVINQLNVSQIPRLSSEFTTKFKKLNEQDYNLYKQALGNLDS